MANHNAIESIKQTQGQADETQAIEYFWLLPKLLLRTDDKKRSTTRGQSRHTIDSRFTLFETGQYDELLRDLLQQVQKSSSTRGQGWSRTMTGRTTTPATQQHIADKVNRLCQARRISKAVQACTPGAVLPGDNIAVTTKAMEKLNGGRENQHTDVVTPDPGPTPNMDLSSKYAALDRYKAAGPDQWKNSYLTALARTTEQKGLKAHRWLAGQWAGDAWFPLRTGCPKWRDVWCSTNR